MTGNTQSSYAAWMITHWVISKCGDPAIIIFCSIWCNCIPLPICNHIGTRVLRDGWLWLCHGFDTFQKTGCLS